MRGGRTPGRRERERVAQRVRAVLSGTEPVPEVVERSPLQWAFEPAGPESVAEHEVPARGSAGSSGLTNRLPIRVDPGRRGAVAIGLAAVAAAVVTGAWVRAARPHALPVTEPGASTVVLTAVPSPPLPTLIRSSGAPPPSASGPPVVVDVAGRVRRPGLYTLPAGARVYDAVTAAGGMLPGVRRSTLNLAARVSDGQQIVVGLPGVGPAAGAVSGGSAGVSPATGAAAGPVSLNTATLEQLDALPGVGPVLAQHIFDWRAAHGSFASVDQLREVSGIGEVKFAALRPRVTL